MDAREEAVSLLERAQKIGPIGVNWSDFILTAIVRRLDAMDEDLQKLRKELRTRNGGENG